MIFVRKDLDHLDAVSFLRILRNVGAPMDVVLLLEPEDGMTEDQARSIGFHSALRKEYQTVQLCSIITDIMTKQETTNFNQNSPRIPITNDNSNNTNATSMCPSPPCREVWRSTLSEANIDEEVLVPLTDLLTDTIHSSTRIRSKNEPVSSVV